MNKQVTLHFNCEEDKVKFRIFLMMKHFDYWDKYTDNDMTEEEFEKLNPEPIESKLYHLQDKKKESEKSITFSDCSCIKEIKKLLKDNFTLYQYIE